eukprot:10296882-Lingulodinium_polyedra.AAC.1
MPTTSPTYPLTSPRCDDLIHVLPVAVGIIAEIWRDGGLELAPGAAIAALLVALRCGGPTRAKMELAAVAVEPLPP